MSSNESDENCELKLDSTSKTSESVEFVNSRENQQIWNTANSIHILDDGESATHIALNPDEVHNLKSKGLAEKFEIIESPQTYKATDSYMTGLNAIGADPEQQARFSIEYIQRKCSEALNTVRQKIQKPELLSSNDNLLPAASQKITALKVAEHAEALGKLHTDWWKTQGDIHKCNLYGDRVYRDLKLPLPWDSNPVPSTRVMIPKLRESNDWQIVFTADKNFTAYKPLPGDFVFWNKVQRIQNQNHGRVEITQLRSANYHFSFEACSIGLISTFIFSLLERLSTEIVTFICLDLLKLTGSLPRFLTA